MKAPGIDLEEKRQQSRVVNVCAVGGIPVSQPGQVCTPMLARWAAVKRLSRSTNDFSSPADGSSLSDRSASVKSTCAHAAPNLQALADDAFGFTEQIVEEFFLRIIGQARRRVQQAHR